MSEAKALRKRATTAVERFSKANEAYLGELAELHRQQARRDEVVDAQQRQTQEAERARENWRESIRSKAQTLLRGSGAPTVAASPDRLKEQAASAAAAEALELVGELDALIAQQRDKVREADAQRLAAHFHAKLTTHQALSAELVEVADPIIRQLIALQRSTNGPRQPSMSLPDMTGHDLVRRLRGEPPPTAEVGGLDLTVTPFDDGGDFPHLFEQAMNRAA